MIASLPMYDPPHLQAANDVFWQAIRAALPFEAPAVLTRGDDHWELWEDPDTLLTQVCSRPFGTALQGKVHLVCAPDYALPGCPPAHYNSVLVARKGIESATGRAMAYNERRSQSGYFASEGYGAVPSLETGAHAASLAALSAGDAEIAFIDAHTLAGLGLPDGLVILDRTRPVPAPPFVTARAEWVAPLRAALQRAVEDMDSQTHAAVGIHGLVDPDPAVYLALRETALA